MSWDLASPPRGLGVALAAMLGRPYPRDAAGYEYSPAGGGKAVERHRRSGVHTSTGAKARELHRRHCERLRAEKIDALRLQLQNAIARRMRTRDRAEVDALVARIEALRRG